MRKLLLILFFTGSSLGYSQDIHFSQFMNSSFMYNPGQTGLMNGEHRILLDYRSQWSSVATPYNTYAFAYDTKVFKKRTNNTQMGVGLGVFKDVAGDTEFGTTSITLATSAIMKSRTSNFTLTWQFLELMCISKRRLRKLWLSSNWN